MDVTTSVLRKSYDPETETTTVVIRLSGLKITSEWLGRLGDERARMRAWIAATHGRRGMLKRAIEKRDFRGINPRRKNITIIDKETRKSDGPTFDVIYTVEVGHT